MLPLLPSGVQTQVHLLVPSRKFDLSYDLNFATICYDFQENIEFQFSLGWKALVHRFLGSVNAQRALKLMEQNLQSQVWGNLHDSGSCSHSANNKTFTRKHFNDETTLLLLSPPWQPRHPVAPPPQWPHPTMRQPS